MSTECVTKHRCHSHKLQQHYVHQRTKRLNLHGSMTSTIDGLSPDRKIQCWRSPRRFSERPSPQKRTSTPSKQPTGAIEGKGNTPRKRKDHPLRRSPRKHFNQASLSQISATKRQKLSNCKGLYCLVSYSICFMSFTDVIILCLLVVC